MFEQARTALTGTQADPLDTFPCRDGSLFVAEGGRGSNFQTVVDDLKRQGWRVEQGQPITDGRFSFSEFRAFSLTREGVTVLATWIRSADSETSLLSACTQRPQAHREPVAQPLAVAPSLPAKFSMNTVGWEGPARAIRPVYNTTGTGGPVGYRAADGVVTLNLPKPPAEVLQPIKQWYKDFDFGLCLPQGMSNISVSDPAVQFTSIRKLMASGNEYDVYKADTMTWEMERFAAQPLIYTDRPVRIRGEANCLDSELGVQVDLNLPGGWTFVRQLTDRNPATLESQILLTNPSTNRPTW